MLFLKQLKIGWLFGWLLCGSLAFSQSMTLMTYNIRFDNPNDGENAWSKRKDHWMTQMKPYQPDIFGIQEALPHQVEQIKAELTDYGSIGMGRDGKNQGESCHIFYLKNRFTVEIANNFWLSTTPDEISKGWDAALNRICTYALFKDTNNGNYFWVFNTHLDHAGEVAKTKSLELILTKIKLFNSQLYPVFLMGDFNTEPHEPRITSLKKEMDDSYDISVQKPEGPVGTFNGFQKHETYDKRIDYIFLSKNNPYQVIHYQVVHEVTNQNYPSDHFPVLVKVSREP